LVLVVAADFVFLLFFPFVINSLLFLKFTHSKSSQMFHGVAVLYNSRIAKLLAAPVKWIFDRIITVHLLGNP
jgi:hypothetical protein